MNGILNEQRNSAEPELFGVPSFPAHALYRAARWLDPPLVAEFDVTETFPQDAEVHAVSTANTDSLQGFDFSNTPVQLRDLLITQGIPQWLRDMSAIAKGQ